jgi:hypothetical protein
MLMIKFSFDYDQSPTLYLGLCTPRFPVLPEDSNDRRHARSFRNAHWNYIIHIIEPSNSRKRILYLSDRKGLACQNHEVVVAVDVVEDMGRFVLRRALCLWVELHEKIHQDSRKLFFYIFRSFDGRQARR